MNPGVEPRAVPAIPSIALRALKSSYVIKLYNLSVAVIGRLRGRPNGPIRPGDCGSRPGPLSDQYIVNIVLFSYLSGP